MMKVLMILVAWRLRRALVGIFAVIVTLAVLMHAAAPARPSRARAGAQIERLVAPIEHQLRHLLHEVMKR
jgi:hypothetical protein